MDPVDLRVVEHPKSVFDAEVGDMWREPARDAFGREAWTIRLPDPRGNLVLWSTVGTVDGEESGLWGVTGEPPKITVDPSINVHDGWHGWIKDGRCSDA